MLKRLASHTLWRVWLVRLEAEVVNSVPAPADPGTTMSVEDPHKFVNYWQIIRAKVMV